MVVVFVHEPNDISIYSEVGQISSIYLHAVQKCQNWHAVR